MIVVLAANGYAKHAYFLHFGYLPSTPYIAQPYTVNRLHFYKCNRPQFFVCRLSTCFTFGVVFRCVPIFRFFFFLSSFVALFAILFVRCPSDEFTISFLISSIDEFNVMRVFQQFPIVTGLKKMTHAIFAQVSYECYFFALSIGGKYAQVVLPHAFMEFFFATIAKKRNRNTFFTYKKLKWSIWAEHASSIFGSAM